jgi:hypothetical protein
LLGSQVKNTHRAHCTLPRHNVTLSGLVLPSSSTANCRTSGCDTTVLHLPSVPAQRGGRLFASADEPQTTHRVPLASRTQGWPTRWPRQLTSPHSCSTHRTEQRMLSNNTLHTSPAIAITSLHFSLLTRTGYYFLSLGSPVSHVLSVQCIAYRAITFCPRPLFAAAFLLSRTTEVAKSAATHLSRRY